ncbi:hypothetical protein MNV49_005427 [Pseudohyphozyma bogoriensis]|nr:hypothetical protein MNV49_005427 [Pseudohyphozyma bogoriensis]
MTGHTHHGALDGGAAGAFAGHEGHNGHTGRDALIGAGAGHLAENHHEKHLAQHQANTTGHHLGSGNRTHHQGLPVGTPGTQTTTTTTTVPKPSVGDKISGSIEVMVGKATHNPMKIQEGEIKKTQGKAGLAAAGGGAGVY